MDSYQPSIIDLLVDESLPALPAALLRSSGRGPSAAHTHLDPVALYEPLRFLVPERLSALEPRTGRPERSQLAIELGRVNAELGHPRAEQLAAQLADPESQVVIAGQQAGLLGGPLYTVSKAMAAVRWCQELAQLGRQAVPLFWVATEDHDFAEVGRTYLPLTPQSEWIEAEAPDESLRPVGDLTLGSGVEPQLRALEQRLRESKRESEAERLAQIADLHRAGGGWTEAFCRTLILILGERCPLLLDAQNRVLKQQQAPSLRALLERRREVETALNAGEERIQESQMPLQVKPQPGCSPLFVIDDAGARRRIEWSSDFDSYRLRGGTGDEATRPVADLLELARSEPWRLSPGVLARPLLQDAVLGTAIQVLGPGELSYMAQVAPLYSLLDVAAPATTLRPQVYVLEAGDCRRLEQLEAAGCTWQLVRGPRADFDEGLARLCDSECLGAIDRTEVQTKELWQEVERLALELDSQLEKPLSKTRDQMLRALAAFRGRVTKASAQKGDALSKRALRVRSTLLPNEKWQERVLCSSYLFIRSGDAFVRALFEQMSLEPNALQPILVSVHDELGRVQSSS